MITKVVIIGVLLIFRLVASGQQAANNKAEDLAITDQLQPVERFNLYNNNDNIIAPPAKPGASLFQVQHLVFFMPAKKISPLDQLAQRVFNYNKVLNKQVYMHMEYHGNCMYFNFSF